MGGGQPHAPRKLPPSLVAVQVDQPPFSDGGPIPIPASVYSINQPNPWVYNFFGSSQPYAPATQSPGIPKQIVNPPPSTFGGPFAQNVAIVSAAQPNPWTYTFFGRQQPFAPAVLPVSITSVQVDQPPPSHRNRSAVISELVTIWQPDPWAYAFMGRMQPFELRSLSPGIPGQSADPPPFSDGGPIALPASVVAITQPDPWVYSFIGSSQPYGPKRPSSAIPGQSADPPPFTLGGPYALKLESVAVNQTDWSVNAWPYTFFNARQPYAPRTLPPGAPGISADPPPVSSVGGPLSLKLQGVAVNQVDWSYNAWPYAFLGNNQPYMSRLLPPSALNVVVNNPAFTHQARTQAFGAIRDSWNPPPFDFQITLYASHNAPGRAKPTARGYIIL